MGSNHMSFKKMLRILTTKPETRRQAARRKKLAIALGIRLLILIIIILLLVLIVRGVRSCASNSASTSDKSTEAQTSQDVQLGFTGSVLLSQDIISGYLDTDGIYDFTEPFEYVRDAYSEPDIMSCEVEGCVGDDETGYSGETDFIYPDTLPGNLETVGIDLQMLATNHIYDGEGEGLSNTLLTYKDDELNFAGIRESTDDSRYKIMKKNGIKIAFADYTYGTTDSFNLKTVDESDAELINMFTEGSPDDFYKTVEKEVADMKNDGADYIIYTLHWGAEYDLEASEDQKAIAQKLCDLGVDAIIGSHPYVEQPIEVLTSEKGDHKTFCIYSIGSAFTNHQEGVSMDTGNCEDGVILTMDLHKNAKGKVSLSDINLIPTWVYREEREETTEDTTDESDDTDSTDDTQLVDDTTGESLDETDTDEDTDDEEVDNTFYNYFVLPLNDLDNLEKTTGLSGISDDAKASYERTMSILSEGLNKAKKALVKSR